MTKRYFLCLHCGQVNKIDGHARLSELICIKCGQSASVQEIQRTDKSNIVINPIILRSIKTCIAKNSQLHFFIIGIVFICIILILTKISFPANENWRPSVSRSAQPEIFQSPGTMWNATNRLPVAPLTIITSSGANYYVKLIDTTLDTPAMAIFVKGGQPLEVNVPIGTYAIHYAVGQIWRGETGLFGPGDLTSYHTLDKVFQFIAQDDRITGYTIKLIRQRGGNLSTRSISAAQF